MTVQQDEFQPGFVISECYELGEVKSIERAFRIFSGRHIKRDVPLTIKIMNSVADTNDPDFLQFMMEVKKQHRDGTVYDYGVLLQGMRGYAVYVDEGKVR